MIKFAITLVSLILCSTAAMAQLDTIVQFDFEGSTGRWRTNNDNTRDFDQKNGYYSLKNKRDYVNWICYDESYYKENSFTLESRVRNVSGTGAGVIFEYQDNENYHVLFINSDKSVQLDREIKGEKNTIKRMSNFVINDKNWNTIEVKYNEEERNLKIFINGKKFYVEENYKANNGRYLGLVAKEYSKAEMDYLYLLQKRRAIYIIDDALTAADFVITKLPPEVNSVDYSENVPSVSPDGTFLYYSTANHPRNKGGTEDNSESWMTKINPDGSYSKGNPAPDSLNLEGNMWVVSSAADNNSILLANAPKGNDLTRGTGGISRSYKLANGNWSFPEKLDIPNASSNSDWVNYNLSANGQFLLMSAMKHKERGNDLYVFKKNEDGSWSDTISLGSVINTSYEEAMPFIASDNKTLYFSSDGHPGYGSYDMFVAKRLDDTWQNWTEPMNMGEYINTPYKDYGLTLTASGDFGYLTRYDESYRGDIYSFQLPLPARPEAILMIEGATLDSETNKPISTEVVYNDMETGEVLGTGVSDPITGAYKIVLPMGKSYGISANKKGYYSLTESAEPRDLNISQTLTKDLYLQPIRINTTLRLNNLFFDTGEWSLRPESRNELDKVFNLINDNPEYTFVVEGHTDDVGSEKNNMQLSENRAKAVMDYLIESGLESSRLTSKGYGESSPQMDNSTEMGRQTNRRVELRIIQQ